MLFRQTGVVTDRGPRAHAKYKPRLRFARMIKKRQQQTEPAPRRELGVP